MTFDSWPLLFVIVFHAFVFHAMPRLSRRGILFAVTVSDAYGSGAGRTLVSRYRVIVWSGTAIALAALLLFSTDRSRDGILDMAVVTGNLMVGVSAWLWAYRRARVHAIPQSGTRVASLVPRDTSLPGGVLFAAGPILILLIAAVLVTTHWADVPEGAEKTKALGTLGFAALQAVMMLTMAVSLSRGTRQIAIEGMAATLEQRFRHLSVLVLLLTAYGMAIMLSAVTLKSIPAFNETLHARPVVLLLPLIAFNVGVVVWMFRVGQGGQRALAATGRPDPPGDATPDGAWKLGGFVYYNRTDPAVWVEKRVGLGYTLNFGNPSAWLLIGIILVPVIVAPLLFR